MIVRMRHRIQILRRWLSRSEWAAGLLRLSKGPKPSSEPGLVMIQIDGLSHTQLRNAIDSNRMPFLKKLITHDDYHLESFYSGLPSSTPAVQGELFYGHPTIVPAFSFRDHRTGKIRYMYHSESAEAVEEQLARERVGLLVGGSAYSDIYLGGAGESHFCARTIGWDTVIRKAHPLGLLSVAIFYSPIVLRIIALMLIEILLAIPDSIRGIAHGRSFRKEITFIPTRVAICILLRELITIGACMDTVRGLPIIHLNFLGYDEQSHRRGPSSRFAHWTLKGIDRSIRQIARTAHRSPRRAYEVWVYSDHGQEHTIAYDKVTGHGLEEMVRPILESEGVLADPMDPRNSKSGIEYHRAGWLGALVTWLLRKNVHPPARSELDIPAMGPLGHLYLPAEVPEEKIGRIAKRLTVEARIPAVVQRNGPDRAVAWTSEGRIDLPEEAEMLLGGNHPFLHEVGHDLVALAHHPDSGTLILCGWKAGEPPMTFPHENGSHAGYGSEETHGFALLPSDAPITLRQGRYLRPIDLSQSARRALGPYEDRHIARFSRREGNKETLRLMTYNVHTCRGMDGRISTDRIARIITQFNPDIVALQELDVHSARTGGVDQAHAIAQRLEMEYHFHPAMHLREELYGDAILSSLPIEVMKAGPLPAYPNLEPRGAIWVTVPFNGRTVNIINTHAGLWPKERAAQIEALIGPGWLGHPKCQGPAILCGDFNLLPRTPSYRKIASRFRDAQAHLENHQFQGTWLGIWRIDHIFLTEDIQVVGINIPRTRLTRIASDHLPVIVDLVFDSE